MPTDLAEKQIILETTVGGRPAVADVLHEHIEEIGYLSIQWRKLLFSKDVPLRLLRRHMERIEAHLDGLRVGGPASISIASEMLEGGDPWFVYAAARVWMEMSQPSSATLCERLQKTPPELWGAWREAFRKLSPAIVSQIFSRLKLEALPVEVIPVAADALGWHGLMQPDTTNKLISRPEPGIRRAVARHPLPPALIAGLLEDENILVRRTALWSWLRLDASAALKRCRQIMVSSQPDAFAVRVTGMIGDGADEPGLLSLLRQKSVAPAALLALRDLGRPGCAGALLEIMEGDEPDLKPTARDVFESLAGAIPKPSPEQPLPQGISPARAHWLEVRKNFDGAKRFWQGRSFPWQGTPADEPMGWIWMRNLTATQSELAWLNREVPDGFFADLPSAAAVPGE